MTPRRSIWDLGPPEDTPERIAWIKQHGDDKPVQMDMDHVLAGDALERDPTRYRDSLPDGVERGPKWGPHRVIL
jgi:hypothetical protein